MEEQRRMTWEEFEADWLKRHKRSLPRLRKVSAWGLIGGLFVWSAILIATSALSGAHSIPVVQETIRVYGIVTEPIRQAISVLGFAMMELTIFASALFKSAGRYAKAALILSLTAAVTANLHSTWQAVASKPDLLTKVVAVILGIAAPITAYLAGEMVARLFEKYAIQREKAVQEYEALKKKVDADINTAHTRYNKEWDAKLAQARERLTVQERSDVRTDEHTVNDGVQSRTDVYTDERDVRTRWTARTLAERLVQDGFSGTIDDVQREYGASRGTAQNARKLIKEMNGYREQGT